MTEFKSPMLIVWWCDLHSWNDVYGRTKIFRCVEEALKFIEGLFAADVKNVKIFELGREVAFHQEKTEEPQPNKIIYKCKLGEALDAAPAPETE